MIWPEGTGITFPKKIDSWFVTELIRPKMAYLMMVVRSGKEFYYSLRYWKGTETPWTMPQLIKDRDFIGRVQALVSKRDKFPQAFIQRDDFHIDAFYVNADDLPEIKEIEGEKFWCGNSARQILRSHVKLDDPINGENYLFEYEDRIIESDCNFVREDMIDIEKWGDIVIAHTEKFVNAGITIQYTLADADIGGYGDYKKAIQLLKSYPIIWEAGNEFSYDKVKDVIDRVDYIKSQGLISSGGAWGNSEGGREASEYFLNQCVPDIITMHRPYPPIWEYEAWIKYLKGFGKPIIQNEFLESGVSKIENYARISFKLGLQGFNVYGGDGGIEYLGIMGNLCKEFNP